MPRLVKKTATAPVLVGDKHICMCGLSENQPLCDKSHHKTKDEDKEKLYWYEGENREEVTTEADECEGCTGNCCHED
ncbi:MAG: hypothetical protein UW35_C0050G0010 [Candidatus Collierbacteria bacterium GW2011_GWF2_44_15]|uniref:Iron-binding zinc finger CDGSH type domain-containing protein n=1 Tax=Candidatus Collierbacteria bacterium GW2011_GWF2_44_15 TaxID=1618404 RepID=A0A0G1JK33_9BACT|nr:MAG: hypothetical protein UW35_C0050G0010 [Candidatus Collierbacteria bacterium GW2011_GWF2_44_15]